VVVVVVVVAVDVVEALSEAVFFLSTNYTS
jgi:hypothetical protein